MQPAKFSQFWASVALAVAVLATVSMPWAAASSDQYFVVTDQQSGDGAETDGPGGDEPGTAQRPPGADEPSEDGTEDHSGTASPDSASPESPPGCTFQGGPLELFV